MKKFLSLIILMALLCSGCRYPEGPGISFIDPEYRIIGNWVLEEVSVNDEPVENSDFLANRPGNYYIISSDYVMSVSLFYNNVIRYSYYGSWHFQNNCKELIMDFSLINQKYYYVATLKKLTKKEMIYEYDDAVGNHWRLHFYCISRVN